MHMGLDKPQDEVLFGHRRARYSSSKHKPELLRMTWMKCVQLSVQLSSWLGLPPSLSSAKSLRNLASFCEDPSIPRNFAALTEIQRQVARLTAALEDTLSTGVPISMVQLFDTDLNGIKEKYSGDWTVTAELDLQAAKLHLYALCLLPRGEQGASGSSYIFDTKVFIKGILHKGMIAAVRLIQIMTEASVTDQEDPACTDYEEGGCPLLAFPKNFFCSTVFATCFLFYYLGLNQQASAEEKELARNSVSASYELFMHFPSSLQHTGAARLIEVLGRSIVPNQKRMESYVTSRLSASLMYDAIWIAGKLRGRHLDPEFSTTAPTIPEKEENLPTAGGPSLTFNEDMVGSLDLQHQPDTIPQYPDPSWSFPWGQWDDAVFDNLALGVGSGFDWNLYSTAASQQIPAMQSLPGDWQ
ncbi:hypothetical protein BJ546DRAFT_1064147 [Cryomyces antarcticus]